MVTKNLEISYLLDFYGDVLTEKQRDVMEQYYNDDLSLSEIADNFGITRQVYATPSSAARVRSRSWRTRSALRDGTALYRRALNRWSSSPATSISTTTTITRCPRTSTALRTRCCISSTA